MNAAGSPTLTSGSVDGLKSTLLAAGEAPAGATDQSASPDGLATTARAGARPRARELQEGEAIGRYVILSRIGHGGMGVIYAAQDPDLDRRVALKFLLGGESVGSAGSARLLREAQSLAQLSHPNIVAVHDVGVLDDRVWIAMEFLEGPNLARWSNEKPRRWREVLPVFLQAGAGLRAAHAAGFVHRDFKPENVMFGRDGRVRVIDFGLARAEQARDESEPGPAGVSPSGVTEGRLTMTGTLLGTPRYMAPEQWNGAVADAKSDQFSFCVSLWEALFGEPPFPGQTLAELAVAVQQGRVKTPAKIDRAPGWVRAALLRGLRTNPSERWPSMDALLRALETDPRRRRQLVAIVGAVVLVTTVVSLWWGQVRARRDSEIETLLEAAGREIEQFSIELARADEIRTAAFAAFDSGELRDDESLWSKYLTMLPKLEQHLVTSAQKVETALSLDGTRYDVRARMANILLQRALLAERTGQDSTVIEELVARMRLYDVYGESSRRWEGQAEITVTSEPPGAQVALGRYGEDKRGFDTIEDLGVTPLTSRALERGSYRLQFKLAGRAPVVFPFVLGRAEAIAFTVPLPPAEAVPEGFVFVPAGKFLYGEEGGKESAEELRAALGAEPIHEVTTGAYLIGRYEVSYAQYIEYLTSITPEERDLLLAASAKRALQDDARLTQLPGQGGWQLELHQGAQVYTARTGEKLNYEGRTVRAEVVWEDLPLTGIDAAEAEAYFAWLDRTGKVQGARFCTEHEWERAARGADGRRFSIGQQVTPAEANIDMTYGRISAAFGPDPVGSYPQAESPFGLLDTIGNAYELTVSTHDRQTFNARGGAFFYNAMAARVAGRFDIPAVFRHSTTGLRVCATWPPRSSQQ